MHDGVCRGGWALSVDQDVFDGHVLRQGDEAAVVVDPRPVAHLRAPEHAVCCGGGAFPRVGAVHTQRGE